MRNAVIGLVIGLIVGIVLGVTILTPKIKTHSASKSIVSERDLEKEATSHFAPLPTLSDADVLHWRSAPPFPSDRPNVANQARVFSKNLSTLTGDKIILPVLAAKETIAPDRLFGALASGRIDALFSSADIAVDKEPALAVFSALPFGPKPQDTLAWLQAGTGTQRLQDLFAKHNVHALVCGFLAPEASGWFVKEINATQDLKSLRIRISGLGAKVWEKTGAIVTPMLSEDIAAAFDQDTLDAAVFSTPKIDAKSGFSRFAKNYYFPGWQNQGQPLLLLINARSWKRLDQERKSILKASCDQQTSLSQAHSAQQQFSGLSDLSKQDVKLLRMPSFILNRLRDSWKEVLSEEARRNPDFRETWEDLNAFVKIRKTWADMGYMQDEADNF